MHQVDLFMAPGFEEIELVTIVDILRRADINTRLIAINDNISVTGAHQMTIEADIILNKADTSAELQVLP
ncbi:MAG: DJ-1/PfpI family protein, partial [Iodobacter sp.]